MPPSRLQTANASDQDAQTFRLNPSRLIDSLNGRSTSSRAVLQQAQSPLFRLPAEIRLHIFELVLKVDWAGPERFEFGVNIKQVPADEKRLSVLSVLGTCRRVLAEAEDMYYAINRLEVRWSDYTSFVSSLEQPRRDAITSLTIWCYSATPALLETLQQLALTPNVKSLWLGADGSIMVASVRSWEQATPQLMVELGKLEFLEELKILMPGAWYTGVDNLADNQRLVEVEKTLQAAVKCRRAGGRGSPAKPGR